jgi:hypothetical protein
MKKILIPAVVVAFAMASCAKDRSCSCTETYDGTTYTYKRTIVESTKGQAKANCVSYTMVEDGETTTVTCKLD